MDEFFCEGWVCLLEVFEIVDGYFCNFFVILFEGGYVELCLIEDDDLLEVGLEIFVCLFGKKFDLMLLMFGGE